MLGHRGAVRENWKELPQQTKQCEDKGMTVEEMAEDVDYSAALDDWTKSKEQVVKVEAQIKAYEDDLTNHEKEFEDAKERFDGGNDDGEANEDGPGGKHCRRAEDDLKFGKFASNDGSAEVPGDKIPSVEHFD